MIAVHGIVLLGLACSVAWVGLAIRSPVAALFMAVVSLPPGVISVRRVVGPESSLPKSEAGALRDATGACETDQRVTTCRMLLLLCVPLSLLNFFLLAFNSDLANAGHPHQWYLLFVVIQIGVVCLAILAATILGRRHLVERIVTGLLVGLLALVVISSALRRYDMWSPRDSSEAAEFRAQLGSDDFNRLVGPIPDGAVVTEYWWSGPAIGGHTYVWKLEFDSETAFDAAAELYRKHEVNIDGLGIDTGIREANFPSWWNVKTLESYEGRRMRDSRTATYFFFDAEHHTIYCQYITT